MLKELLYILVLTLYLQEIVNRLKAGPKLCVLGVDVQVKRASTFWGNCPECISTRLQTLPNP